MPASCSRAAVTARRLRASTHEGLRSGAPSSLPSHRAVALRHSGHSRATITVTDLGRICGQGTADAVGSGTDGEGGRVAGARLRVEELARLRRAAGLRQADLAVTLGVHPTRISEWERGDLHPHPRHLLALARALDVLPLALLDCDPQDPSLMALRLAAGLTLRDVEERAGVPYASYRRLESGLNRRGPTSAVVDAVAAALGVDPQQVQRAAARGVTDADGTA